eukprot:CAMPEP_0197592600 /NCGR_PEP_ID=MMETSP1326-20131121/15182_1 /TAXON_ID=1155430 /ORGANISM="Genus nov. species nov., Strain RCC2288" /LENGTH=350 /DNA_ID=CAMNT_0043158317 /DNA_START=96 /DNA_END=1148 /DNA_ORIENTATION=-
MVLDYGYHNKTYQEVNDRLLGKGSYGMTKLMREKATGTLFAIKYITRGDKITDHVRREIVNHRSLCHPFVVNFKEVLVTETHLGVVMEYVSGGELFNYVQQRRSFNEAQARYFFQHLISGVEYLHHMRVVHRDLKLENTLVDLSGPSPQLKICDFGYSKSGLDSQPKTRIGTPAYIAPEVYQGIQPYDGKASDVWACGVVLYVMLAGRYPFQDPDHPTNNHATMWRVLDIKYEMPPNLSDECKDLLRLIFVKDPHYRIPIAGIGQHPWFVRDLSHEVPLGPTQPGEGDTPTHLQIIEEIDAVVEAAKVRMSFSESGGSGGGRGPLGMYDDDFGDEDSSGIITSMASAGEF